jgi:fluoride exporter
MTTALVWAGVAACGALGALGRFRVAAAVTARRPSDFPFGTFVVNLTGGFVLGLLVGVGAGDDALLVLGTGFLGGYTTFSTWMVEAQRLGESGEWPFVWLYLFGSMGAGLATTGLGWALGSLLA